MITAGTWYPPSAGTGGFLSDVLKLTNPPFTMTDPTLPASELSPYRFAELLAEAQRISPNWWPPELAGLAYAAGVENGIERGGHAQLLECIQWLRNNDSQETADRMLAAFSPPPLSTKAQALEYLYLMKNGGTLPPNSDAVSFLADFIESFPDSQ